MITELVLESEKPISLYSSKYVGKLCDFAKLTIRYLKHSPHNHIYVSKRYHAILKAGKFALYAASRLSVYYSNFSADNLN